MLKTLFNPNSIAVIGASKDPKKVGFSVLNNLKRFGYKGRIIPINPNASEVLGFKAYPKTSDAGSDIDMAVIAIPAKFVPDALIDCSKAGVSSVVVLSAGFKEVGHEGLLLEQKCKQICRDSGIRMLGPNCLGVINTANDMNASFAGDMLAKGRIAFFSQSGALGIAIMDWALGNNIGFSKFISLGNKTDLSEVDFIEYFINDDETDVILGYIEDVVDGKRFMQVASKATKIKPVILIKSGSTSAGARAASSHTGALAGSETAFNSAFKQTGVIRASGIEDLFDTAMVFSAKKFPANNRLLIVTNAGGPGILAADMSERCGLMLPQLSHETLQTIEPLLPESASLHNPVDIIGDATSERYATVLNHAIYDPNISGILVILTPQAMTDVQNVADIVIHTASKTDKPVIASFIGGSRVMLSREKLKLNNVPCFGYPETAVSAFKKLYDFRQWTLKPPEGRIARGNNRSAVEAILNKVLEQNRLELGEDYAMDILSHYGFTFPQKALARSAKEAGAIAERMGFPVVMKISSPDILHKTDIGGVKLNINSVAGAEDAFIEITSNVRRLMPDAFINGVMIYEMIKGGKEVILGVSYDATFGHMIMFGLGGIYVEVLKDVSFRIAPVSYTEAEAMTQEIKTIALLRGTRGERPADIDTVIDGILRLSDIVTDFPIIKEIDINPMLVMHRGAFALDARIILSKD